MPNIVNDGGVVHSSRDIVVNAITFATDNFSWDIPTGTTIERTNGKNIPTGVKYIKGRLTGSATLQASDADSILTPADWGAQFTTTEGVCTINSIGRAETKDGETKFPITFSLNITTNITTE